jgi:transcriptional regulator with XRE-family HTH domain
VGRGSTPAARARWGRGGVIGATGAAPAPHASVLECRPQGRSTQPRTQMFGRGFPQESEPVAAADGCRDSGFPEFTVSQRGRGGIRQRFASIPNRACHIVPRFIGQGQPHFGDSSLSSCLNRFADTLSCLSVAYRRAGPAASPPRAPLTAEQDCGKLRPGTEGIRRSRRMTFARNLRRFRKQAQLSQAQLAEKTGFSLQMIRMWERGDAAPGVNALLGELARALGVTVQDRWLVCASSGRTSAYNAPSERALRGHAGRRGRGADPRP